jgi:hypothetical protein
MLTWIRFLWKLSVAALTAKPIGVFLVYLDTASCVTMFQVFSVLLHSGYLIIYNYLPFSVPVGVCFNTSLSFNVPID